MIHIYYCAQNGEVMQCVTCPTDVAHIIWDALIAAGWHMMSTRP